MSLILRRKNNRTFPSQGSFAHKVAKKYERKNLRMELAGYIYRLTLCAWLSCQGWFCVITLS